MGENEQLRELLKRVCFEYSLNQSDVAEAIGIAKQTLCNYAKGHRSKGAQEIYESIKRLFPPVAAGPDVSAASSRPMTPEGLKQLIRRICFVYGVQQRDCAARIGVTPQALSNAVQGRTQNLEGLGARLREAYPQAAGRVTAVSNSRDGGHAITVSQSNHSGSNSCTVGDAGQVRVDSLLALLAEKDRQISRLQEQVTQLIDLLGRQRQ